MVAPALPMASVPTGTPPGIWTIESSESRPLQRGALHRHAEHRQHRVRRDHPRQMRRAARARDDHLDAARFGAGRELGHPHRRAVRRNDVPLVLDAELLEHIDGVLSSFPSPTMSP